MNLQLTSRWISAHQKTISKELEIGHRIEYYGHRNVLVAKPEIGYIDKDTEGFFIEWETSETNTRIDNSKHSLSILLNCGFTL